MLAWIPLTLAAAVAQVARTGLQKKLSGELDIVTVTWVRYAFACPLAAVAFAVLWSSGALVALAPRGEFLLYCLGASVAQIIATLFLLATFRHRNFAIATTYAKTEGVQFALLALLLFGSIPSTLGWAGIIIGALSIILMAKSQPATEGGSLLSTAYGLGSGLFFALTIVCIRLSYGALETHSDESALTASALTLVTMVTMQTILLWLALWQKRVHYQIVWQRPRLRAVAAGIGITSFVGSFLWFICFYIANPAYVKILAQIELPLAYIVSRRAFEENPNRYEIAAMLAAAVAATLVLFA